MKKAATLICSLILGLGPWVENLPTWAAAIEPANMIVGLTIAAGIVLAFLSQSPIKPKQ